MFVYECHKSSKTDFGRSDCDLWYRIGLDGIGIFEQKEIAQTMQNFSTESGFFYCRFVRIKFPAKIYSFDHIALQEMYRSINSNNRTFNLFTCSGRRTRGVFRFFKIVGTSEASNNSYIFQMIILQKQKFYRSVVVSYYEVK